MQMHTSDNHSLPFNKFLDKVRINKQQIKTGLTTEIAEDRSKENGQNMLPGYVKASFKDLVPTKCSVLRDGKVCEIDGKNIVVGDIVMVKPGDRIPADMRIIDCYKMYVDNSAVTGEATPQVRWNKPDSSYTMLRAKNVAFLGTSCTDGEGTGIVFSIGEDTYIGQIATL